MPSTGITLALVAPGEAKLPSPPERAPKDGTMAGFAKLAAQPFVLQVSGTRESAISIAILPSE